jgi:hypothetical protein
MRGKAKNFGHDCSLWASRGVMFQLKKTLKNGLEEKIGVQSKKKSKKRSKM